MTDLGTVISTPEGPSPSSITFVVTKGTVHRGQFVELDYSQGTMIALVSNVYKTNRYFERAESVKEFESNGTKLMEQFPAAEWEYLVGETYPLGVFKDNIVKRPTYPPSPGTKVRLADSKNLEKFLNIDKEHGIELGEIEHHKVPVKLNLSKFLQKHCAILAQSGFGKSYSVSVLLEELLDRKKESGRIATIVLDPHGEYSCFAEPTTNPKYKDYSSQTTLVKARNITIGVPKLSIGILSNIIPSMSGPQKRDLQKIISDLQKQMKEGLGPFDLKTVKSALINDKEINDKTKKLLLSYLDNLEELRLFGKFDSPSISDVVKPGHLTIIDLSDITDMKKKQIIVSYFAQKLFYERRKKSIPPFLLVVEEAHQFIPETVAAESAIAKSIMKTIAREGRKFGASLCLVSQRPIQLDTTVLSQCNNKLILRITNPYDLDHIGKSAEGIDKNSQQMLTSLRVGEALIVGEATGHPVFFKVRKRKSQPSKHEIPMEQAARDFETNSEQNNSDTEQFL
ncbi:MAG: ATP-binding protein [Candidatus Diapherotrites archaeon]